MSLRIHQLFLVPLFLLIVSVSAAQNDVQTASIFLWVRGDLWRIDAADLSAAPVQVTSGGTISAPVLSPDGAWIAYKAAAEVGLEALNRLQTEGFIADFDLPSDLYVLNTVTGESRPLVGQPANASLFVEGVPDQATSRSAPVWSPDGESLAWAQIDFGQPSASLIVLNRESMNGVSTPINTQVYGIPPNVAWLDDTITVWITLPTGVTHIERFDQTGTALNAIEIAAESIGGSVETLLILNEQVNILNDQGEWRVLLPDGASAFVPSPQITITPNAQSYRIGFGHVVDTGFFWEAYDPLVPDAATVAFPGSPSRVTLSPDGRAIAFLGFPEFGAASIYQNGELLTIPNTGDGEDELNVGAILWGSPVWQTHDDAFPGS